MELTLRMLNPWCHPNCHYLLLAFPALLRCLSNKSDSDHFFLVVFYVGTVHLSYLLYAVCITIGTQLSSVSRSRMRSEDALPLRTLTLFRIAVGCSSHTIFARRGSKFLFLSLFKKDYHPLCGMST
jgi:hypothetical protein